MKHVNTVLRANENALNITANGTCSHHANSKWTDEKFLKSEITVHKIESKFIFSPIIRLKDVLFYATRDLAE